MTEIDNTITRINYYDGVERILIIKSSEHDDSMNILVRSQSRINKETIPKDETEDAQKFARHIPKIGKEARSMIRQFNSKNDLKFLRIRTTAHEILIAPDKDYYLCVVQNLEINKKDKK